MCQYCKRIYFGAVHIFTDFVGKYVQSENLSSVVILLPSSENREFKYTQKCTFKQIHKYLYMRKYIRLQYIRQIVKEPISSNLPASLVLCMCRQGAFEMQVNYNNFS